MYMLQLFDADDAIKPIDARLLRDGLVRIGRDPQSDWTIPDPERALSRAHCELAPTSEGLLVRSIGANGVFDEQTGARLPDLVEVPLPVPCALRMGRYTLRASPAAFGQGEGHDPTRTMILTPPIGASSAVPTDWSDASTNVPDTGESLLDAFCRGAGLDASLLSSEDPALVMERAGAVYRQMVLGVADLMGERDQARTRYNLARTTIGGSGNNPFKWAPTQRLAVDLLLSNIGSFLSGPAAIASSLHDIKRHLIASFAGYKATLRAAVAAFEPASLERATEKGSLLSNRHARQMSEVAARHEDLVAQLDGAEGSLDRAFVRAYAASEQSE